MSKNGIQTPNFAHKIETCINPFRKWCTTYFIILMDQLGKTNTKTRQKWTELKENSPFTIRKGSAELMLFVTKFQTTWSNLSMKREAQFSIFIYNVKKQSQKYCVKFFASLSEEVCAGTTQFLLVMLYFGLSLLRRCSKMWQSNV